ncbi:DHA3 family macrolide efflux protein-like MFS transporter [Enterococcus sp. PF1-24]|uniref:MFS transporter n=1 Tax=unclassified Enterococcus TaxID=2608891 RepID=UPI002475E332|nr:MULTISPECIES: MFS transporter [unclassified Enterococcus]MDH6363802.1 DHA3 family macrolide efflux protein-like MFS transporter [Enterococcus sp. PFB1-1]MDH6401012.1 DHA3 family macrolide efflux protein-like MFS transporter [Enterococcus sp. PF1-24]
MVQQWKKKYFTILAGQTVSLIGSSAVQFALIWWLTNESKSAMMLSLAGLFAFLPQMLLGPFVGVWLDRLKRKNVVIAADLFMGVMALVLSLWFLLGKPSYTAVIAVIFLRSLANVFHTPSIQAIVPVLVPEEQLIKANSWSQFLQSGAFMLGPVIGAAMYAALPLWMILLTDLLGALVASVSLCIIPIPNPAKQNTSAHYLQELKEGLAVFKENKPLLTVTIFSFFTMIFFFPLASLFPLMTNVHFSMSAWFASLLEFAYAVGMMAGAFIIGLKTNWKDKLWAAQVGNLGLAITVLVSGLAPSNHWGFGLFVVMSCLMGGFGNLYNIPFNAYLQENVPQEKLGRVFSLFGSVMSASMPIGLLIAGPVSDKKGIAFWFAVSGALMILFSLISIWAYTKLKKKLAIKA